MFHIYILLFTIYANYSGIEMKVLIVDAAEENLVLRKIIILASSVALVVKMEGLFFSNLEFQI